MKYVTLTKEQKQDWTGPTKFFGEIRVQGTCPTVGDSTLLTLTASTVRSPVENSASSQQTAQGTIEVTIIVGQCPSCKNFIVYELEEEQVENGAITV